MERELSTVLRMNKCFITNVESIFKIIFNHMVECLSLPFPPKIHFYMRVVVTEEQVEAEAEVKGNAEVLGSGKPGRRVVRGGRWVAYFWRKCHWLCMGLKKASLINDSFISEVKSRQRWRPRRRGGHLSPPRKLHGKNILKCISKMVP